MIPVIRKLTTSQVASKHTEPLLHLHVCISAILRIISCNEPVNISRFEQFCQSTVDYLVKNFKWALLNHTLHGSLQHSAELISKSDGIGLGAMSEEGLEANNKDIREFLKSRSRKCDPILQMTDVMNRLLERSDPIILRKIENLRSKSSKSKNLKMDCGPLKYYDTLVNDLLL